MTDAKVESKYIEKDPPMANEQQLERKHNDYLAYLKEKLNFVFANYFRRLTDVNGNINELTRTAEMTSSRLSDAEGNISEIAQRSDSIEFTVVSGFQNLRIGGRNLLRNSGVLHENNDAPIVTYMLGESIPDASEEVTIQIAGSMGTGAESFKVVNSDSVTLCELTDEDYDNETGVYRKTIPWVISSTASLSVYSYPTDATRTASIVWAKLERGNQATDWTPAPEDQSDATSAAASAASAAQASADAAQAVTSNVVARMQFTTEGLKISGTEASRDNSYVNIAADKQTFVVNNQAVMELGADGINTQGDITAAGTIKGGSLDTGHWRITENASGVWSLNYHAS